MLARLPTRQGPLVQGASLAAPSCFLEFFVLVGSSQGPCAFSICSVSVGSHPFSITGLGIDPGSGEAAWGRCAPPPHTHTPRSPEPSRFSGSDGQRASRPCVQLPEALQAGLGERTGGCPVCGLVSCSVVPLSNDHAQVLLSLWPRSQACATPLDRARPVTCSVSCPGDGSDGPRQYHGMGPFCFLNL